MGCVIPDFSYLNMGDEQEMVRVQDERYLGLRY